MRLLIKHVIASSSDKILRVETATANLPVMALYTSMGFEVSGEYAKADGLRMSRMERKRS